MRQHLSYDNEVQTIALQKLSVGEHPRMEFDAERIPICGVEWFVNWEQGMQTMIIPFFTSHRGEPASLTLAGEHAFGISINTGKSVDQHCKLCTTASFMVRTMTEEYFCGVDFMFHSHCYSCAPFLSDQVYS